MNWSGYAYRTMLKAICRKMDISTAKCYREYCVKGVFHFKGEVCMAKETPKELDLHLIVDNYATHKHPDVKKRLAGHKRIHVHFIPTSSSWLNVIERWFRDLTEKRIRRGAFRSVPQLEQAILEYVDQHNEDPKAFEWTAKADAILEKVERAKAVLDKMQTD